MKANTTAARMLTNLIADIQATGSITVSQVCIRAGMNPSMVSRWKAKDIEPRLSTLERLQDAFLELKAEREKAALANL